LVEKVAKVLAHIAGTTGSGKSTLLERLQGENPGLVVLDLDEIDEAAMDKVHPKWNSAGSKVKDELSDAEWKRLHREKQKLLNKFLKKNESKPVVLGGYHDEGYPFMPDDRYGELKFDAANRWRMDVSPLRAIYQQRKRAWQSGDRSFKHLIADIPEKMRLAREDAEALKELGYKRKKSNYIAGRVKEMMMSDEWRDQ